MITNVWNKAIDAKWYEIKRTLRPKTFRHVTRIIQDEHVDTLMEIGGGPGFFAPLVQRYINVELCDTILEEMLALNPRSELIVGDFMDLDLSAYRERLDMILALAVVQHVHHYGEFIQRTLALRPALIVISFSGPMLAGQDLIRKKVADRDLIFRLGHTSYHNIYSRALISRHLDTLPETLGRYRFRRIVEVPSGKRRREETILTIRPRYLEAVA